MIIMGKIIESSLELIGNTPLLKLNNYSKRTGANNATILAKLEYLNPAGSVKDRIALAMIEDAEKECSAELYKHHFEFESALSCYLPAEKVEAVKDGMTYNVVKVTYDATLDMIPSLKEEEKVQILAWLKEAREFAMDAENSNKKHGWFGKYKGRINNYLSKRGYDLVKEREGWYKRIEERKAKEAKKKK